MRARHFLALFAVGLTVGVGVGCGGDGSGTGGTGGEGGTGGGTGGTTTTSTSTSTSTTTSTGTTTPTGDGNDSFAEAIMVDVLESGVQGTIGEGELSPIETDNDYFSFTGTKGQAILLFTVAKTATQDPFADGFPDLVITLYDANEKQIAQNDDPIPRNTQDSSMYTVLPADGTYYVKVEEFCQVLGAGGQGCDQAYFDSLINYSYQLYVFNQDPAENGNVAEGADNDMPQDIAASEYVENQDGTGYFAISIQGTFKDANDVDVYNFTVPNTIPVSQGRETAFFEIYPVGPEGNGSAVQTGKVWIEDSMGNRIAESDGAKLDPIDGYPIEAPIVFGDQYSLHVQSGGNPPAGGNNFYFVLHYRGGSNPVEMGDDPVAMTNNDDMANAEILPINMSAGGFEGGFVAGDITAGDVDYYKLEAVPAAGQVAIGGCSAQRVGSGLRNLKITLINGDTGMPIPGGSATETADTGATLGTGQGVALGGATNVMFMVEATQDAMVTGTYYSCGVVFFDLP